MKDCVVPGVSVGKENDPHRSRASLNDGKESR